MPANIPRDAHAIIIGAMKCGTSSLFNYLSGHPQICPAKVKEPEYFSEHQGHAIKVGTYADLWNFQPGVHRYALEASTGYTKFPLEKNVPATIFRHGIFPRFIYIIRNPFDRIASHFNFMQHDPSWKRNMADPHLIATSNYFLQLEQYRRYFDRRDFLILDFDELKENPAAVLRQVYMFLGLSEDYFPEEFRVMNATDDVVPAKAGIDRHVLSVEERERVYAGLAADMKMLYQVYGFDVTKWGFAI